MLNSNNRGRDISVDKKQSELRQHRVAAYLNGAQKSRKNLLQMGEIAMNIDVVKEIRTR